MSVVSAKDQTARDRSPVHVFVCFRESRFVTCVDKPVSFQHCTATTLCFFKTISCVSTMARSSPSFVSHSTVRTKSATQSSPCQWTNYTIIGVSCSNLRLNKYTDREGVSRSVLLSSTWASSLYAFHRTVQLVCSAIMSHEISVISFIELQWLSHSTFKTQTSPLCAHFC